MAGSAATRRPARAAADLHAAALAVEDRLDTARLPEGADRTPLDRLPAAVLTAEVLLVPAPNANVVTDLSADVDVIADDDVSADDDVTAALAAVREQATAVRRVPARAFPHAFPAPAAPAIRRRTLDGPGSDGDIRDSNGTDGRDGKDGSGPGSPAGRTSEAAGAAASTGTSRCRRPGCRRSQPPPWASRSPPATCASRTAGHGR